MEREFNDMKDVFKVLPTTQEEKEYMIVIGKHLATNEKFPTREAAEERINSIDWNLITAMIHACKEAEEYEKKLKRTAKKVVKEIENDAKEKEKPNSFQKKLRAQNKVMEQKRMEE